MLELNKDWDRYGLIGGKQEPQDMNDYRLTVLREIEEEIGVPKLEVRLVQLTEKPLESVQPKWTSWCTSIVSM